MIFAREGVCKPWEIGRLTILQLHQARYVFDAEAKAQEEASKQ